MFKKRIGPDPHASGEMTGAASGCPDIWELEDGNVAIIGLRKTTLLQRSLPSSAACGIDEEIVVVPRSLLKAAAKDIEAL